MEDANWAKMGRIETAWERAPICETCGEYTTVVAHPDGIWLECLSLQDSDRGFLARREVGHMRKMLVENEGAA